MNISFSIDLEPWMTGTVIVAIVVIVPILKYLLAKAQNKDA